MVLSIYLLKDEKDCEIVYGSSIPSNLSEMAREAGIYDQLYSEEYLCNKIAKDIEKYIEHAVNDIKNRREHYKKFNPEKKNPIFFAYLDCDGFLKFLEGYLTACKNNPDSVIRIYENRMIE